MYRQKVSAVVLAAFLLGFAGAASRGAEPDEKSVREAIRKAGGSVRVDDKAADKPVIFVQLNTSTPKKLPDEQLTLLVPQLAVFKSLRGVDFGSRKISDSTLQIICKTLPDLRELGLDAAVITDEGLKAVGAMKNLEVLRLNDTTVGDEGMKTIGTLARLKTLGLDRTKITDEGMKALKTMPVLQEIRITSTAVTDAGLRELKTVKTLEYVYALKSKITKEGAADLKKTLPKVYVAGP